jgi:hypothetical protein
MVGQSPEAVLSPPFPGRKTSEQDGMDIHRPTGISKRISPLLTKAKIGAAENPMPTWTLLELELLGWAVDHWPMPVDAMMETHYGDWTYWRKCFGAIFRKCATDQQWLYWQFEHRPKQVVMLGPFIKSISWSSLGYPESFGKMPGRVGWKQFLADFETAGMMNYKRSEAVEPYWK